MRLFLSLLGAFMGSLFGSLGGGLVGWCIVRVFGTSHALSNPDLGGGMAWMFVFCFVGAGLLCGAVWGFWKGAQLYHELPSESDHSADGQSDRHP